MSKYDETDHKKAWLQWKEQGLSMREISEMPEMPTRETVRRWAGDFEPCSCPYHNWRAKRAELLEQAQAEVEEELDLPSPKEREKNQLKLIYKTQKQIEALLESGDLEQPGDMETAVRLLKELNDEERILKGEAQAITEVQGGGDSHLSLTKIAQQLNLQAEGDITPETLREAAEEATLEDDIDVD